MSEAEGWGEATQAVRQVRGSSLLLGGRAFAVCVNLATQVLLIRYLAATDYGVLAYILSLTWVARNLSTLGLHRLLPRLIPQYHERGDRARVAGAIALQAATIAVVGLGLWLVLLGADAAGRPLMADEPGRSLVLILTLLIPLEALDYFGFEMVMAAFHRPRAIALRKHVLGPLIKLAVVATMVRMGADVQFLAMGLVAASVIGIAVYVPMTLRLFDELGLGQVWRSGFTVPWSAFGMAIPLLSTDLALVGRYSLDAVLVGINHGFTEVASLRAVQPIASLNDLVAANFGLLFLPLASRLAERRAGRDLDEIYWRTASWQTALSIPIFLLTFSLAGTMTVMLAGEAYASSAPVLAVLAFGYFVAAAIGPSQLALVAIGRIRYIVVGNVVTFVFNVLLLLWLVPPFGALGAAIATSTAFVALCAFELAGLRRTAIRSMRPSHLGLFVTTAAAGALLMAIEVTLRPAPILAFAIAGAMVLLLYRLHRRTLGIDRAFPELRRIPGAALLFGPADPDQASTDPDARGPST